MAIEASTDSINQVLILALLVVHFELVLPTVGLVIEPSIYHHSSWPSKKFSHKMPTENNFFHPI